MARTTVKAEIKQGSPDEIIKLGEDVKTRSDALGELSPVKNLNLEPLTTNLTDAKNERKQAKLLHEQAEALNQQANVNLGIDKTQNSKTPGTVYSTLTSVRNVLLEFYKGQEEKLSEWGFKVVRGSAGTKTAAKK